MADRYQDLKELNLMLEFKWTGRFEQELRQVQDLSWSVGMPVNSDWMERTIWVHRRLAWMTETVTGRVRIVGDEGEESGKMKFLFN